MKSGDLRKANQVKKRNECFERERERERENESCGTMDNLSFEKR
jgi:hypothetical protein